jgi:predicted dehydrogenase
MSSSEQFNVGIIGFGFSAKIFHIPFINIVPEFKLYAIVQRSPTPDDDAANAHVGVKTFRQTEDMLRDEAVNLVIVTTSSYTHYTLTKQVLEAGKHGRSFKVNQIIIEPYRTFAQCRERTLLKNKLLMHSGG